MVASPAQPVKRLRRPPRRPCHRCVAATLPLQIETAQGATRSRASRFSYAPARARPGFEQAQDAVRVVDRTRPRAAARVLERGPQPACPRAGPGRGRGRDGARARPAPRCRGRASRPRRARTKSIVPSRRRVSISIAHEVAVAQAADGPAGQRLRRHVADAGAGGDAGEARVRDRGRRLREVQVPQRRRHLVDLLHPRPARTEAGQDQHLAGDAMRLALMAAMAARSLVKTCAGPMCR